MGMDPKLVDKRVVARNLERGRLDAKAYGDWIDALPDVSDQAWQGDEEEPQGSPETLE